MDSLDVRILRTLHGRSIAPINPEFRDSLAAIARKIGEDEDTVRHRLRKLHDSGFFAEWRLFVNPHLWGGGQVSVWFDVDPASPKRDLVEKLRLVPGVIFVNTLYDSLVAFLDFDDEVSLPRKIDLIRKLSGAPDVFVARTAFPECQAVLTARDWDLIRALRKNPRRSYADLAEAVGVSSRTVTGRLSRIAAQCVAFAWPSLNLRAVRGGVLVHLAALYPGDRKVEVDDSVMSHLEPCLWHILHMMPYRRGDLWPCGYDLFVPNMSVAREILGWVKQLPGVETARAYLHEDIFNFFDAYDEELDRKLSRMPTAMPTVRVRTRRRATVKPVERA